MAKPAGGRDDKDTKKAAAAVGDLGKKVDELQKKLVLVAKLAERGEKKPEELQDIMKQLQSELDSMAKAQDAIQKAATNITKYVQ